MKQFFQKYWTDIVAVVFFAVISLGYFSNPLLDGKVLSQHDTQAGAGTGQEAKAFREATGETTRWTNSTFGGMPTYQISPSYDSTNLFKQIQNIYDLHLPTPAHLVFMMLLGFFILLRVFGARTSLAVLGAIMWAFSSYFFIIIQAGHIWKFVTLAYVPPTIAGIVLAYNKKYLQGGLVTAFFMAMQVLSNHMQMTYYFVFVIVALGIAYFVEAIRKNELPHFFKASAVLVGAAIIGICINLTTLFHTYDYTKHTMRGKSELQQNVENHTKNGLERDYIVQWSYGIDETLTLLIPNFKGGASAPLSMSKEAMKVADPNFRQFYDYFRAYFGTQPFTSGPVYAGAFVFALFILGLIIVKGAVKWALLGVTVVTVMLSWGQNFMGLTDFFLNYVPMYNKFRAVSSILVVAEFTIPLMAILALKKIFDEPEILKEKAKLIIGALGGTAAVCLLTALSPAMLTGNAVSETDQAMLNQMLMQIGAKPEQYLAPIMTNLEAVRYAMVEADAWRSLWIILVGSALLFSIRFVKIKPSIAIAGMIVLSLFDLGMVNKRYLNDTHFMPKRTAATVFAPTEADKEILKDTDPDYRVLNFTTDTFNDAITSYFHKSVGGYHAAKLRRYQDVIDNCLRPEMDKVMRLLMDVNAKMDSIGDRSNQFSVINMLNTKYFIVGGKNNVTIPIRNPYAYGNAWFVDEVKWVSSADEEIAALNQVSPLHVAIIDQKYKQYAGDLSKLEVDSAATINLTSYKPNHLTYQSKSLKTGVAVFSEVYYEDGWIVKIDGKEVPFFCTDYILRGVVVPAGEHTIEFIFDPVSLHLTERIAYVSMLLLALGVIAFFAVKRRTKA